MTHRLEPLLNPRSVAVIGASAREDSMGFETLNNIVAGGYAGDLYPVNPGYESLFDLCVVFANLLCWCDLAY